MTDTPKLFSFKIACLSLILLALFAAAPLALAQSGARLYFQPVESANGVLTVDVMAENVTDLYGLELHLKYDPAVLEIQDSQADQNGVQIQAGTLLPVNQGFVVANQADQAAGTILYALTLLNPAPAVSGSGPVARITFKTLQNIPSTINVEQATLVSVSLQTIPTETAPLTVGGTTEATVAAATPANTASDNNFPWWVVAAAVLGLGLLALGGLVVLGGFTKKVQPKAAEPQADAQRRSGGRPSAFKESALPKPPQPRQ